MTARLTDWPKNGLIDVTVRVHSERPYGKPHRSSSDKITCMVQETPAYVEELAFWEAQIRGDGMYASGVLTRLDLSRQPPEYRWDVEPVILDLGRAVDRRPRVLDVGAGPASVFSYGAHCGRFELVAADPLADQYIALLRKYGYSPTCPMVACRGEDLDQHFPDSFFDFTWSWNAIDHAVDPPLVVEQMVTATRIGGIISIHVFENEGTAAGWSGLHQHNLTKDDAGNMVCTGRAGETRTVADPRVQPWASPPLGIIPKIEGRRWLSFAYRRTF
jgi:SAM-dependent methyltransferase